MDSQANHGDGRCKQAGMAEWIRIASCFLYHRLALKLNAMNSFSCVLILLLTRKCFRTEMCMYLFMLNKQKY